MKSLAKVLILLNNEYIWSISKHLTFALDWCTSGGQQLIPGTVDCEDCDLGTYKPVGMMGECILCNKTSYQDQKGQTDCKLCTPDGYHTMAPGAKSLSDCSAGK